MSDSDFNPTAVYFLIFATVVGFLAGAGLYGAAVGAGAACWPTSPAPRWRCSPPPS